MNTNTYDKVLETEKKLKHLYEANALKLSPNSRLLSYFRYLADINKAPSTNTKSIETLFNSNPAKYYFSLYYCLELESIIKSLIKDYSKSSLITKKLKDLSKGTYLLSEENSEDTKARDVEFELALFSFIKKHTISSNVKITNPNPDIQLQTPHYIYNIECKRPQSDQSFETALKKAKEQHFKNSISSPSTIRVIAISLEHIVFNKKDLILQVESEKEALQTLDMLVQRNVTRLEPHKRKVLKNESFVIIYYLSCLSGFKNNSPFAYTSFMSIEVYNFWEKGKRITRDLNTSIKV